jgi:hypothetical protein
MELNATEPRGPDRLLKKKYAAMHHLDVNIGKSLNIGLFEGIISEDRTTLNSVI